MKYSAYFFTAIVAIAFSTNLFAQTNQPGNQDLTESDYAENPHWIYMMKDLSVNFYDVQEAFNVYFDERPTGKGTGWKQFKRWEYFTEQRVYPTGERINHAQVWNEMMKFREQHPDHQSASRSQWTELGPKTSLNVTGHWNPGIGRINVIARDPVDTMTLYIGAPSGGCWKTTDEGNTWQVLTDDLPVLGVSAIAIDPTDTDIVYIGTGDRDHDDNYSIGVLKSTDGGLSWNLTGLDWSIYQNRTIAKLLINPDDPSILFAATTAGLYRTTDAGDNWTMVRSGNIDDIEFKPGDPNTIYAVTERFYKSTDGGDSFTETTGFPPDNRAQIAVTEANPDYVYFFSSRDGIYRSEDSGDSFTKRSNQPNPGNQDWYDLAMAVSHVNPEEVHIGEINTWRSMNGGTNWTQTTDWTWGNSLGYTHCDIHEIVYFDGTLFVGSDGLVSKSTNQGDDWTNLTEGIGIRQFYRIGVSKTDPYKIVGGSQDNGTSVYTQTYWHEWLGADGMEAVIDYSNSDIVYGTTQGGNFNKSTAGGTNTVNIAQPGGGSWVTPFVIHPTDPQTLFVANDEVRKTTNGMGSWSTISSLGLGNLNALALSDSDPDYIYASKQSNIYRTTNGGANWEYISGGLPGQYITYIAVHPDDPELIAVSLSGYNDGEKVYISEDAGDTWLNYSSNLPNLPANCVAFYNDPSNPLYVGMDVGVYYIDDNLDEWESFMTGLPNVIVNELEINYTNQKIRAATYGRGLWEADVHPVVPQDFVFTYAVHAGDDEIIEFGETVSIDIILKNNMDHAAENVGMLIRNFDPYVTLTDTTESFGTIQPGDSVIALNAFSFDVTSDIPDDYDFVLITFILSDTNIYEDEIDLTGYAPIIEHGNITIYDGGNGTLDPGETADIDVEIINNGGAAAHEIDLVLTTFDPYVTINNSTLFYIEDLEPGISETISFNLSVDEATPIGHVIELMSAITAASDYENADTVVLKVGLIHEDFETGNFLKFPWEFAGDNYWYIDDNEMYEGSYSARSGVIGNDMGSILFLDVEVSATGEISFYKKVSCENDPNGTGYDYLAFFIDDDLQGKWDGEIDWSKETFAVDHGAHTFTWTFHKDGYVAGGSDRVWVDYILFPAIENTVGVEDVTAEAGQNQVFVFPNPSDGRCNIMIDAEKQNLSLRIMNQQGQLVQSENIGHISGPMKYELDISRYPAGIYFITLTGEQMNWFGKVVVYSK